MNESLPKPPKRIPPRKPIFDDGLIQPNEADVSEARLQTARLKSHREVVLQSEAGILLQELHDAIDGGSFDDEGAHIDLNVDAAGLEHLLLAICAGVAVCDGIRLIEDPLRQMPLPTADEVFGILADD